MFGALVGDLIGSASEGGTGQRKDFEPLISSARARFTDDSVRTCALALAIYRALQHGSLAAIRGGIAAFPGYDFSASVGQIRPGYRFDATLPTHRAAGAMREALERLYERAGRCLGSGKLAASHEPLVRSNAPSRCRRERGPARRARGP